MPFELARRYSRLPRWGRRCLQALAAALGVGLVLAVFALLATGEAEVRPFGQDWRWLSLACFAALNLVSAVLGNRAYDAYRTWESARLPSAGEFFRNHDLARLVGQSIGMTLRACEPELPDADARTVHRLAERAERDWPVIAARAHARERLPEIRDDRLLAFVRDPQRPPLSDDQVADLLALLLIAVGLSGWYLDQRTRVTLETGQQRSDARLAAIEAQLREALTPKQAGEDPTQRQLPPELIAKARELAERANQEQQAVAAIALRQHAEADRLIQDLKRDPLAETFRLLTLEGDNWYNAGEYDRAIGPYEQAMALRPEDPQAMNNAAIAHVPARLGNIAAHQRKAVALLTQAQA